MTSSKKDQLNYQSLNDELNRIIEDLQSNNLDIDKVLAEYERGVEVITKLEDYLGQAENKIKKVSPRAPKNKT
jgi:exodeoxyribonuclease VII small subunit